MTAGHDQPLAEARRRAYLQAMGIDLWLPRGATATPAPLGAPHPSAAEAAPPVPAAPSPPPAAAPGAPPPQAADTRPPTPREPQAPPPAADDAWGSAWEPVSDAAWEPVWEPELVPAAPPGPAAAHPGRSTMPTSAAVHAAPPPAADPAPPLLADPPLDWDALAAAVAACRACALCATRTQTVFGVGDRQARLLVIGEAPGADEDREGEPFVGRAGRLLNHMLAAIGLARGEVYIANILKCRPPNNRNPHPGEVTQCHGYLARQVELIRPRVILSVGAVSAQNLLGTDTPVGRLRGRWFDYGPDAIPLRVTYHPAYLLRSPDQKAKAWEDLIAVARRLRADG